jgi:hypothetical protein
MRKPSRKKPSHAHSGPLGTRRTVKTRAMQEVIRQLDVAEQATWLPKFGAHDHRRSPPSHRCRSTDRHRDPMNGDSCDPQQDGQEVPCRPEIVLCDGTGFPRNAWPFTVFTRFPRNAWPFTVFTGFPRNAWPFTVFTGFPRNAWPFRVFTGFPRNAWPFTVFTGFPRNAWPFVPLIRSSENLKKNLESDRS